MIDITKLKNDKERIAFLEDYRNTDNGWELWKADQELGRRWWRFCTGHCFLIVEEEWRTFEYPRKEKRWTVKHWYIMRYKCEPFGDQVASRTMALTEIKKRVKR